MTTIGLQHKIHVNLKYVTAPPNYSSKKDKWAGGGAAIKYSHSGLPKGLLA